MLSKYFHFRYLLINDCLSGYKWSFLYHLTKQNVYENRLLSVRFSATVPYEKENNLKKPLDSVHEKYREMVNELSKAKNCMIEEMVYKTNFGHVRFDSDNFLTDEEGRNHSPKMECHKPTIEETHHKDLNFSYIDDIYFEHTLANIGSLNSELQNKSKEPRYNEEAFKELTDLNFIDAQYMEISPTVKQETSTNTNVSEIDVQNLNYVDSQYCGQTVNPTKNEVVDCEDFNFTYNPTNDLNDIDINLEKRNSKGETVFSLDINQNKLENVPGSGGIFSFGDSLLEDSESNFSIRHKKNDLNETVHRSSSAYRENLEKQILELSDSVSHNLLKNNPKLRTKKEKKEKEEGSNNESEPKLGTQCANELPDSVSKSSNNIQDNCKSISVKIGGSGNVKSAYDYVMEKRREEHKSSVKQLKGDILPHEKYKKILLHTPRFSEYTVCDMVTHLKNSVLYNKNDIVALYKPYGIPLHGGSGESRNHQLNIVHLLPQLANVMKEEKLFPIHRLDMNTTGILLLAKTDKMADKLKKMFQEQSIKKTYLAITKGIPDLMNGIIDIPIGEGKIEKYQRMVLCPDIPEFKAARGRSKKAITRYKVLSRASSCSLLEVNPITGVKHQLRVHLGFGINCPILGDHKYSHLKKMAPQRLPGVALDMYGMKPSAVRHLPLHLHAFSVSIPGADENGGEVFIRVGPPKFFKLSLTSLKLSNRYNRIDNQYSDTIYGYV